MNVLSQGDYSSERVINILPTTIIKVVHSFGLASYNMWHLSPVSIQSHSLVAQNYSSCCRQQFLQQLPSLIITGTFSSLQPRHISRIVYCICIFKCFLNRRLSTPGRQACCPFLQLQKHGSQMKMSCFVNLTFLDIFNGDAITFYNDYLQQNNNDKGIQYKNMYKLKICYENILF